MTGREIRAFFLVLVITFGAIFCVICWIGYKQDVSMIVPAVAFTGIYIWILCMEVWGALTGVKKTLSTRFTNWTEKHPVLGWAALLSFVIAMVALAPHLGVWAK